MHTLKTTLNCAAGAKIPLIDSVFHGRGGVGGPQPTQPHAFTPTQILAVDALGSELMKMYCQIKAFCSGNACPSPLGGALSLSRLNGQQVAEWVSEVTKEGN